LQVTPSFLLIQAAEPFWDCCPLGYVHFSPISQAEGQLGMRNTNTEVESKFLIILGAAPAAGTALLTPAEIAQNLLHRAV